MTPDTRDTIAAIATARGAGQRGVVRLSGEAALAIAERVIGRGCRVASPQRIEGREAAIELAGESYRLPCDLLVWPDERSYTHQPSVELHTVGSPPLLEALLSACLAQGARLAEPGEFTLRAFLAGRLDLTQAEAVLAVIDAQQTEQLGPALRQLAGGLSGPLHMLRADLLDLLADLEAGLDFVDEEDVRFVEQPELVRRVTHAAELVAQAERQTRTRGVSTFRPRVALIGPANVGKSRLFNALVDRYGEGGAPRSLVADQPGVTRDYLAASVRMENLACELIDTAGDDAREATGPIDRLARGRLGEQLRSADLRLVCFPASGEAPAVDDDALRVATMADLGGAPASSGAIATSAATGEGLEALAEAIAGRLGEADAGGASTAVAHTAERCAASLAEARGCLSRAAQLAGGNAGEELVSHELRAALDALGRVVGAVVTDDILDQVFGKFCIGK